jgi:hypothetical protein
MRFHFVRLKPSIASLLLVVFLLVFNSQAQAQPRRNASLPPPTAGQRAVTVTGQRAVVVDERLAALREAPELSARLLQRMSRGRKVSITGSRRAPDDLMFYRVALTKKTFGWVQSDAVITPARKEDEERLMRLIRGSEDFDRLSRARIFLELFPKSLLRPIVLMLYAEAAEEAAGRLSRDASRRLDAHEMQAGGAPDYSYFLNYNGLDRYNRQGVAFLFDRSDKKFHYDGAAWREIVRRYPQSAEAEAARKHLAALAATPKP